MDYNNTIDVIGEQATLDGLISGTLTEYYDDKTKEVGNSIYLSGLRRIHMPNLVKCGSSFLSKSNIIKINEDDFPKLQTIAQSSFTYMPELTEAAFTGPLRLSGNPTWFNYNPKLEILKLNLQSIDGTIPVQYFFKDK